MGKQGHVKNKYESFVLRDKDIETRLNYREITQQLYLCPPPFPHELIFFFVLYILFTTYVMNEIS